MSDKVVSGSGGKRQKMNEKKKDQADQKRKYEGRRIYLGKTWDEWERQRSLIGKCHWSFAAHLLERHAGCSPPPRTACGL